jgi:hypothetical protein
MHETNSIPPFMKSFLLAISIFAATVWLGKNPLLAEEPYVQWVKTPFGSSSVEFFGDTHGGVFAWDQGSSTRVHLNAQGGTISSNEPSLGVGVGWRRLTDVDRAGNQYWTGELYANGANGGTSWRRSVPQASLLGYETTRCPKLPTGGISAN